MKKSSLPAQKMKRTVYCISLAFPFSSEHANWMDVRQAYPIRIVLLQNPASALIDALVTLITTAHRERRVHVNVMACKIQTDQSLEEDGPARESRCQEDEQARCRAAISDHIQYSTKLCGLIKGTGGVSIERIEQAGERVEEGAGTWV